jgi:CheY-like chemotaxis protein
LTLTSHEAEVKACASAEALRKLDEWRPNAPVSDVGTPAEDGHGLMSKVRAREPECGGLILAMVLTAYARSGEARRGND